MKVLIACEESQAICKEFRKMGHEAYSCDLQECSGGHPEWHIVEDVLVILSSFRFYTQDRREHFVNKWDLMIGHPECKYLCFSGERWMKERPERVAQRSDAFDFFKKLYSSHVERICLENSRSIFLNTNFRKPDQTVHPYHFGDPFKKATCLWLKGLPPLTPTNILPIGHRYPAAWMEGPGEDRSKKRAKTYPGIAVAMATQWGNLNTVQS